MTLVLLADVRRHLPDPESPVAVSASLRTRSIQLCFDSQTLRYRSAALIGQSQRRVRQLLKSSAIQPPEYKHE
jgi:hypothetical protein